MAKVALSFASSILCVLFFSSFFSGEFSLLVNGEWCVSKSGTPEAALMFIIDDICGKIKDCLAIMDGGPCYFPNTTSDHASFIMNLYYKTMVHDCNFSGVGEITQIDRSHGECVYV